MGKIKIALKAIKTLKNWPLYFADYLNLIGKPEILYKLRNEIVLKIRPKTNDRVIFNQIWLNRVYEPKGFEIKENDIVLDVGAHIGLFSILASSKAREGKIYAFEPTPANFEILKENIELNQVKIIFPINSALADETGTKEFILSPADPSGNSFSFDENNFKKIKVPAVSLDDFVKQNNILKIDFLKMDCEGAEYEIFYNCSNETLKKVQKISMEYHDVDDERTVTHIKNFLEKFGFNVSVKTEGDNMLYAKR